MSTFTLGLITGALGATFIIWVTIIIRTEQKAYQEIKANEYFKETLNELEHYKKAYWLMRDEQDADYWG